MGPLMDEFVKDVNKVTKGQVIRRDEKQIPEGREGLRVREYWVKLVGVPGMPRGTFLLARVLESKRVG